MDVALYTVNHIKEENGQLSFLEMPFTVNRAFYVSGVRTGEVRGHHAHKGCHQLLICLKGAVNVVCDDGHKRVMYILDSPIKALHIPPMIWAEQYYHSEDTLLMGLASNHFDEDDYIRHYEGYLGLVK